MKLTIQQLKEMKPNTIFAVGSGTYPELYHSEIRWVTVRGGIHDWCIYYQLPIHPDEWIKYHGDKIHNEEIIKRLVPCDDEAFEMYRR